MRYEHGTPEAQVEVLTRWLKDCQERTRELQAEMADWKAEAQVNRQIIARVRSLSNQWAATNAAGDTELLILDLNRQLRRALDGRDES